MKLWRQAFCGVILFGLAFTAPAALAQMQSVSFGNGLGTLTYGASGETFQCRKAGGLQSQYTRWSFRGFVYTNSQNVTQSITAILTYIDGLPAASGTCLATKPGPTVTFNSSNYSIVSGYSIVLTPGPGLVNASIAVPGYINPKYAVVGVIYAPPGSQSFVTYSNTKLVSNTTTITNTFLNSITKTVKVTTPDSPPIPLLGFLNASQTQTQSSTLTQQSKDSTSVTANYTNTQGLTLFGPGPKNDCGPSAGDFIGVDHDCDLIKVWVNPVLLFTVTNGDSVEWDGYGFSALDTTAPIHIVDILVGCLNGDIAAAMNDPRCAPSLGEFQRAWAANENWPAGQGPALTQADLNNILAADPWGLCTPNSPIGASACPTFSTDGTFTLLPPQFSISSLQNIPYHEGAPETVWSVSTTDTTTQGQDDQTSFSQTFGIENAYTGSGFLKGFGGSVSTSQTLTTTYEVNNSTTMANTAAGQATIIGAACNGSPCTPSYPPTPALYGTGTEFDIFLDHFFGTFAFVPSSYE
jgi:hypothetical protein